MIQKFDAPDLLRSIWASVFGAAYVADFEKFCELTSFDRAVEVTTAERAETIADHAVAEWLRWNREGKQTPEPRDPNCSLCRGTLYPGHHHRCGATPEPEGGE